MRGCWLCGEGVAGGEQWKGLAEWGGEWQPCRTFRLCAECSHRRMLCCQVAERGGGVCRREPPALLLPWPASWCTLPLGSANTWLPLRHLLDVVLDVWGSRAALGPYSAADPGVKDLLVPPQLQTYDHTHNPRRHPSTDPHLFPPPPHTPLSPPLLSPLTPPTPAA